MSKCLFIAGTATDVGKTFISALVVKCLREAGYNAGYYKAAASGVELNSEGQLIGGDPIYVNDFAKIGETAENLVSYVYAQAVSPHLAARMNKHEIDFDVIKKDFERANKKYDYLVVEGSGGIICPLRWDDKYHLMLLDIVSAFKLPILLVADAGLGTINSTFLTVDYLIRYDFNVAGIILNHFKEEPMELDNLAMIEEMTSLPVIAKVQSGEDKLNIDVKKLIKLFY